MTSMQAEPSPAQPDRVRVNATRRRSITPASFERWGLILVWLVVLTGFGLLRPQVFLTAGNFSTILGSQAVLLVLTLGLLIPLTTNDYDLSVAGTLSLSAMSLAILNGEYHWPLGFAIIVSLALGALVGVVNGALVVLFRIDAFIVTLGTGTILVGVVLWISHSNTVTGVSTGLTDYVITNHLFGIPVAFYYGLLLCIIFWYMFEFTALGRRLLFVGRNRRVSRLSGLNVGRIRWGALIACGTVASAAGVLYVGTTGAADPSSGATFLLPAFAAAFLGATSILPGRFNAWGTFVAVYFLVTGVTGLTLLGAESYVQNLFYGGALVIAVAISQALGRGGSRTRDE